MTRTVVSRTVGTDIEQGEALRLSKIPPKVRFLPDGHTVEVAWDGAWEKVDLAPVASSSP